LPNVDGQSAVKLLTLEVKTVNPKNLF